MSLKELQLPSIASLRAIAALKSPHLALVRPARIGLGFEFAGGNQKSLLDVEEALGGPGRLSLPYSLRWLLDVLTGLGVLHRTLGFVHGEVQPDSVVLGEDGIGRLVPVVRAHWARGEERAKERLYYLAPEKLLGDHVDKRSDVFSAGVMLWEALQGQRLMEAFDVDDIIARFMSGGIPRARVPEGEAWTLPLTAIAERAISVDPARRFDSVGELKDAIEGACQRYVASTPGMAELFRDPASRARSLGRESLPPESQRATLPPAAPPAFEERTPVSEGALEQAAERLSRASFASVDLEEELTTKPNAAPKPPPEPLPVARPQRHVNTLLGVPPPYVEPRDSYSPDSVTTPFVRSPLSSAPPAAASSSTAPSSIAPTPLVRVGELRSAAAEPSRSASPPAVSLSPLVTRAEEVQLPEPSFELIKPRKRRGALWLTLGVAAAVGLFAARPWLSRQVTAATGAQPDRDAPALDATVPRTETATPAQPSSLPADAPRAARIASTPPAPSDPAPKASRREASRDPEAVIHDSVDAAYPEPPTTTPEPEPPAAPEPAAEPTPEPEPAVAPPAAAPAPAPTSTPKPKPAPVSDGDRYGI